MSEAGWGITFILVLSALIAVIAIVVIWQLFRTTQARIQASATTEDVQTYQRLHEETLKAQQQLISEITELKTRLGNVEKLLRDVGYGRDHGGPPRMPPAVVTPSIRHSRPPFSSCIHTATITGPPHGTVTPQSLALPRT